MRVKKRIRLALIVMSAILMLAGCQTDSKQQVLAVTKSQDLLLLVVAGCQQKIPKEALQLTQESLAQRQAQTRRFDTSDETMLLSASAAVLQDLGFNLDESETELGLVVKVRSRH